jgi:hypothetical protein
MFWMPSLRKETNTAIAFEKLVCSRLMGLWSRTGDRAISSAFRDFRFLEAMESAELRCRFC